MRSKSATRMFASGETAADSRRVKNNDD